MRPTSRDLYAHGPINYNFGEPFFPFPESTPSFEGMFHAQKQIIIQSDLVNSKLKGHAKNFE